MEVDICISETGTGDGITTNSDAGDGSNTVEQLEEHGLRDTWVEFADVQ